MIELLVLLAVLAGAVLLPLVLLGVILRVLFHIILLPLHLIGAVIGLLVSGVVLAVLLGGFGLIFGFLALGGILIFLGPILLVAFLIWLAVRHKKDRVRTTV